MIDSKTSISCDDVDTLRLFWQQSSGNATVQIIDLYVSSSAHILLADCTLYDSPNHWHIQAIIQTEMSRHIAGWLSKAPLPLIGETHRFSCIWQLKAESRGFVSWEQWCANKRNLGIAVQGEVDNAHTDHPPFALTASQFHILYSLLSWTLFVRIIATAIQRLPTCCMNLELGRRIHFYHPTDTLMCGVHWKQH